MSDLPKPIDPLAGSAETTTQDDAHSVNKSTAPSGHSDASEAIISTTSSNGKDAQADATAAASTPANDLLPASPKLNSVEFDLPDVKDMPDMSSLDLNHELETPGDTTREEYIHIRVKQRNRKKCNTTVEGVSKEYDVKKILKILRKTFACNGTIADDDEHGEVIQLTGDHRNALREFLVENKIAEASQIKIHGA